MKLPTHSVTVVRTIKASAVNLYGAWTDPTLMRCWLAMFVDADVRVGGHYRIENREPDGTLSGFTGEYLVLEPGRRIVKTFTHTSTEPGTFVDEFVEVSFRPLGPRLTEVTLINGWDGDGMKPQEREQLKLCWGQWLGMMESVFDGIAA